MASSIAYKNVPYAIGKRYISSLSCRIEKGKTTSNRLFAASGSPLEISSMTKGEIRQFI